MDSDYKIVTPPSFPPFETAVQIQQIVPFWGNPVCPLIKIGLTRFDWVGFGRIEFDSQMGSFGKKCFCDNQACPPANLAWRVFQRTVNQRLTGVLSITQHRFAISFAIISQSKT